LVAPPKQNGSRERDSEGFTAKAGTETVVREGFV
jgi:hypothetical protein